MLRDPTQDLARRSPTGPEGEHDLVTWAWRRAASVAVAVPVASLLGSVFGLAGTVLAGGGAVVLGYVLGPLIAASERARRDAHRLTTGQVIRHWASAAVLALVGVAGLGALHGFDPFTALFLGLGLPIAVATVAVAAWAGRRLPPTPGRAVAVAVPVLVVVAAIVTRSLDTETRPVGLLDAVLIGTVALIVPATLHLLDRDARTTIAAAALAPATAVGIALDAVHGTATLLVLPAVVASAALATLRAARWLVEERTVRTLPRVVTTACLAFGAAWLLAGRL